MGCVVSDLFKCFLEENIYTSTCPHFVDKFRLFPSVILLSTSSLDESWEAPSPSVAPLSTASLHDLCKNSVKSDNSLQYWGPLWHIVLVLLILLNKFLLTSSPLLISIQAGMIWETSVLPHWHEGSLHTLVAWSLGRRPCRNLCISPWWTALHCPRDFYSKISNYLWPQIIFK